MMRGGHVRGQAPGMRNPVFYIFTFYRIFKHNSTPLPS